MPLHTGRRIAGEGPLTIHVYPGADGRFLLYEDDGVSFAYRRGDWMGIELGWEDQPRRLTLRLADGSRMRPPSERRIEVQRVGETSTSSVAFQGTPQVVSW